MKVSVIITTYNRKELLQRCLRTVLRQTYQPIETIVVDDGSTDGTEELFRGSALSNRVLYLRIQKNSGSSAARNIGLDAATGDYTLVWDSDDELDDDAVETLVNLHKQHTYCTTVSAPTRVYVDANQIDIEPIPEGELSFETILCARMPKYKLVRLVHTASGGAVRYHGKNLDFMVNTELASKGAWIHTQRKLGNHYILSDGYSLTRARRRQCPAASIERAPHLVEYITRFGGKLAESCPVMYGAHAYGACLGLLLSGKVSEARRLARAAEKIAPSKAKHRTLFFFSLIPFAPQLLHVLYKIAAVLPRR